MWDCVGRANKVQPQSTLPGTRQNRATDGDIVLVPVSALVAVPVDVMPSSESFAIALYHNIEYFIPEMLLRYFVAAQQLEGVSLVHQNKHHKAPAARVGYRYPDTGLGTHSSQS